MARAQIKSNEIEFKNNFRVYWSILRNYKGLVFSLLVVGLLYELGGFAERYLFKIIVDDATNFSAGAITSIELIQSLKIIAAVYVALILVHLIFSWIRDKSIIQLNAKTKKNVKQRFFDHIINLDHNFHTTHKTGSLISRLQRGQGGVHTLNDTLSFSFIPLILQLIIAGVTIAFFNIPSVIVIVTTVIIFVAYSMFILRLQESSSLDRNRTEDIEKGMIADMFANIDSVKYYGKEKTISSMYEKLSDNTKKAYIKNMGYFKISGVGQNLILSVGIITLIWITIKQFLEGYLTIGTLVFIYTTFVGMMGYMFSFVYGLRSFYQSMADMQELFEYEKSENEIKDKPNAKDLKVTKGTIEFKDVNFSYGKRKIFEDFNLKIKENEKVALVGHSGSGKTTLIKLLNRFYDVDSGEILIDGQSLKEVKQESVRSSTGIVPQECILFDDTIYNNIKFVNPKASKNDILNAIRFAQLDKIIEQFPDKEDTIVGERGVKLSGGEKQRVSIARAILANKKILVLDEATSSLDSETEHEIQKDLQELLKNRTSIIIAHRLSTIMNADRIVVMKQGKIVQEGKHHQLINQQGEYKKLWNLQKGGYIK